MKRIGVERGKTTTRGGRDAASGGASGLWLIQSELPADHEEAYRALEERVKELNCLYGAAQLVERHADSLEDLLSALIDFLPHSWQWPELTCARIRYEGATYQSDPFREGPFRQAAPIFVDGRAVGEIEIFVTATPGEGTSPFLEEEAIMLQELATRIGTAAARLETNRQLAAEREALQQANSALRTVLARIEEEKLQICRDVHASIEKAVLPVLDALCLQLPPEGRKYAKVLRQSLEEVATPFPGGSHEGSALSPVETTVCNLIRSGLSSKEIADLRGVSLSTVLRQRERIRQKLKIRNEKTNLATFLRSRK